MALALLIVIIIYVIASTTILGLMLLRVVSKSIAEQEQSERFTRLAFEMASIPKEDVEFSSVLSNLMGKAFKINYKKFYKTTHFGKKQLIESTMGDTSEDLSAWLLIQPEEKHTYYEEKLVAFYKAIQIIAMRTNESNEKKINAFEFWHADLKDRLYIDNMPELNKEFQPIVENMKEGIEEIKKKQRPNIIVRIINWLTSRISRLVIFLAALGASIWYAIDLYHRYIHK